MIGHCFLHLFLNYKCLAVLSFIQTHAFSVLTSAFCPMYEFNLESVTIIRSD